MLIEFNNVNHFQLVHMSVNKFYVYAIKDVENNDDFSKKK